MVKEIPKGYFMLLAYAKAVGNATILEYLNESGMLKDGDITLSATHVICTIRQITLSQLVSAGIIVF